MDHLCPHRVDSVRQSPRTRLYGYFTRGTDLPPRPCPSGFFSLADHLRLLPSPTQSIADLSVSPLEVARHSSVPRLPQSPCFWPVSTLPPALRGSGRTHRH